MKLLKTQMDLNKMVLEHLMLQLIMEKDKEYQGHILMKLNEL